MSFSVFGAGLVGCYLGAAGGATGAVQRGGAALPGTLTVRLPDGPRAWTPAPATAQDAGPLLITCRVHQTPWAELTHRPLLAAQNGLDQPVPVVVCFMALDRGDDGVIGAVGVRPRLVVGRLDPCWQGVLAAWRAAGLTVEVVDDVRPAQWEKAILNATVGPLCLGLGLSMAAVWDDPAWRALVLDATAEGGRIASATGIALPPGLGERATAFFARVGAHRPSVLKGPGELPAILGRLLASARTHRVPCPALTRIADLVSSGAVR